MTTVMFAYLARMSERHLGNAMFAAISGCVRVHEFLCVELGRVTFDQREQARYGELGVLNNC